MAALPRVDVLDRVRARPTRVGLVAGGLGVPGFQRHQVGYFGVKIPTARGAPAGRGGHTGGALSWRVLNG